MKRSYDIAMGNSGGQISSGMTALTDNVWLNTNMVNLQREDRSNLHGIQASFSQTRILPIVGKTNRAEIALKSADIQTKCLPIFQPQVLLGQNDPDILCYEAGVQGVWSGSMLQLPPNKSFMNSYLQNVYPDTYIKPLETFSNRFQGPNDQTEMYDMYGGVSTLTLVRNSAIDTTISNLIDYYLSLSTSRFNRNENPSDFTNTCLTPVVIPSVFQKLSGMGPFLSSVEYPNKLFVPVQSTAGFNIGDRVEFFGISDITTPSTYIPTKFGTILDVIEYSLLQSPSSNNSPCLVVNYYTTFQCTGWASGTSTVTFTLIPNADFDVTNLYVSQRFKVLGISGSAYDTMLATTFVISPNGIDSTSQPGNILITCGNAGITIPASIACTLSDQTIYQNGYIVNLAAQDGGRLQFLTDEYEFTPLANPFVSAVSVRQNDGTLTITGQLIASFSDFNDPSKRFKIASSGFFRNLTAQIVPTEQGNDVTFAVEVIMVAPLAGYIGAAGQIDGSYYNGIYRIASRKIDQTLAYEFHLSPISLNVTGLNFAQQPDLTGWKCILKLAPNYYTVNTQVENVDLTELEKRGRLSYMKALGFTPTVTGADSPVATYPPTATLTNRSWLRAFYVEWQMSCYKNLKYISQDVTALKPKNPLTQQDFGYDDAATSTYYNVYDMTSFYNKTVNTSLYSLYNDILDNGLSQDSFQQNSLNRQLNLLHDAYKKLFAFDSPLSFTYNNNTLYATGQLAITLNTVNPTWTNDQLAFMAIQTTRGNPVPTTPLSNDYWFYLGRCPRNQLLTGGGTPPVPNFDFSDYWQLAFTYNAYPNPAAPINGTLLQVLLGTVVVNISPMSIFTQTFCSKASGVPMFTCVIDKPAWKTFPPRFTYDAKSFLSSVTFDNFGFPKDQTSDATVLENSRYLFKKLSFGQAVEEYLEFETNSALKFQLDNFPCTCVQYNDPVADNDNGSRNPVVSYWIWDNSNDDSTNTDRFFTIEQNSESISSCMSPVQSIVIISENIPVVEELSCPQYLLQDSNSNAFITKTDTTALTQKIIGEFYVPYSPTLGNSRSAVKFEESELKYYSLLDTKSFKQIDYSLYYRHRISQQLIPLILSNYGNVNIKFIFRPTSS